jgi:tetratricopeptide (TPR) repeat protein
LKPLLTKGLCHLQAGDFERASQAAEDIEALRLYPAERRWHLYLTGLIELGKKRFAQAVAILAEAKSLEPRQWFPDADSSAFFMEALARAYFQSGDLESARNEYEAITRLTAGRIRHGDLFAGSFYMLGRVFEQAGDGTRARENYRRFLDLWRDADPDLPEVEEAKRRLAGLTAE